MAPNNGKKFGLFLLRDIVSRGLNAPRYKGSYLLPNGLGVTLRVGGGKGCYCGCDSADVSVAWPSDAGPLLHNPRLLKDHPKVMDGGIVGWALPEEVESIIAGLIRLEPPLAAQTLGMEGLLETNPEYAPLPPLVLCRAGWLNASAG